MLPPLQALITFLSRDVSSGALVDHLTSPDAALGERAIDVYPEDGKPYLVTLELRAALAISVLADRFGAYRQARTDRGRPRQLLFAPAAPGPWKVVLIAEVPPGASPLDETATTRLILRRDPP